MHNYTKKIERKQQLMESGLGVKLAYFVAGGIFEANSGCNHHIKSGKIFIDKNVSENSLSLFKILSGSQRTLTLEAKPKERIILRFRVFASQSIIGL